MHATVEKENELTWVVCMCMHTLPACLWIMALIFALLPVIELRGEIGERLAVTLDPYTGPWLLLSLTGSSSHFYSKLGRIYSQTHEQRIYKADHNKKHRLSVLYM